MADCLFIFGSCLQEVCWTTRDMGLADGSDWWIYWLAGHPASWLFGSPRQHPYQLPSRLGSYVLCTAPPSLVSLCPSLFPTWLGNCLVQATFIRIKFQAGGGGVPGGRVFSWVGGSEALETPPRLL